MLNFDAGIFDPDRRPVVLREIDAAVREAFGGGEPVSDQTVEAICVALEAVAPGDPETHSDFEAVLARYVGVLAVSLGGSNVALGAAYAQIAALEARVAALEGA